MDENKSVFRKKSLARINSPEQLNDYIKVASPGIWVIIIGVIVFLVGVCVWGYFGKLDSVVKAPVIVQDGKAYLFVSDMEIDKISIGTKVSFANTESKVSDMGTRPVQASSISDEYFLYAGGFSGNEWLYVCSLETTKTAVNDGIYAAKATIGSTSPMSFVTN